jgi:hypothetical protein
MRPQSALRSQPETFWSPDQGVAPALLEAIVCDTHSAALLTAVLASAVNGFKHSSPPRSDSLLKMYVPQEPAVGLALGKWASEAGLEAQTVAAVIAFFADLEPPRHQLTRFFNDAQTLGSERAMALHRFALASAWRGVCHSAIAAIRHLNAEAEEQLPDFYVLNGGVLAQLLLAAASGETPCLDDTGQPFLPALPQRRRSSRRTLGQTAHITAKGSKFRGFVRDVSAGGFGLDQIPILETGATVSIELSTGRRFAGTVAWYSRGRAGVRFDRALTPNDPMLWG